MPDINTTIQSATHADVPTISKIWGDSHIVDRHTQMKQQGQKPYNMEEMGHSQIPQWIDSEKCVVIKAVDEVSGDIMGFCAWGFRGFEKDEMPVVEEVPVKNDTKGDKLWKDRKEEKPKEETTVEKDPIEQDDYVKKLEAMTDADMENWMQFIMPEGTKCMFVVSLSVAPRYQRHGVGSTLLKWGTDIADKSDIFIWVHSSEDAWTAYQKMGFETVRILDVDLDEWAPGPPPYEGEAAKWGHYVFRYMKYTGRKV